MKNNTFRRLLAMAAAGAMLTSIAACGSSSNDGTASNGSDSTSLISVNNSEPQTAASKTWLTFSSLSCRFLWVWLSLNFF